MTHLVLWLGSVIFLAWLGIVGLGVLGIGLRRVGFTFDAWADRHPRFSHHVAKWWREWVFGTILAIQLAIAAVNGPREGTLQQELTGLGPLGLIAAALIVVGTVLFWVARIGLYRAGKPIVGPAMANAGRLRQRVTAQSDRPEVTARP